MKRPGADDMQAPAFRPRIARGLKKIYDALFRAYGKQHWWPGNSRFEIMAGAVLTQNTAWINVERAIANLKNANRLSPKAIIGAHPKSLAYWLKPSGYFNVKSRRLRALCRWILEQGGLGRLARIPTKRLREMLLSVNGIGPESADDILLYAFNRPVFVIDAYTRRLFSRLEIVRGDEDYEVLRNMFEFNLERGTKLFNEFHALIVHHAKHICRPRPRCDQCCLSKQCRYRNGQNAQPLRSKTGRG
jgi:endonuclease-3 related protein